MKVNILIIGMGAIGFEVFQYFRGDPDISINQVLVRAGKEAEIRGKISNEVEVISDLDNVAPLPDFVLECASHQAVGQYGHFFLEKGIDFGVISIGAFSSVGLLDSLQRAGQVGGAQLNILSGAIGGIDALSAARIKGLEKVTYTSRKPPLSWRGTRAEKIVNLDDVTTETMLYKGNAREAAELFPKNANVAATVALAGLGFEGTMVTLIADPSARGNTHQIHASGEFGELQISIVGKPLKNNPKSSALTALSAVRAIKNRITQIKLSP